MLTEIRVRASVMALDYSRINRVTNTSTVLRFGVFLSGNFVYVSEYQIELQLWKIQDITIRKCQTKRKLDSEQHKGRGLPL